MSSTVQSELLGLDFQELTALAGQHGQAPYRGRQLFTALYRQGISSLENVTPLPSGFRRSLAAIFRVGLPRLERRFVSSDGTIRYLLRLGDDEFIETVWMPEGDGGETGDTDDAKGANGTQDRRPRDRGNTPETASVSASSFATRPFDRATICVSSQVGCAVNCQFCMTALLGVTRSLTAGEIVGQVLAVLDDRSVRLGRERINLVFMGMGEPFLNYDAFMKAVRLLVDGVGIAESRMTVSTVGIEPRIRDFGQESVRPKLAISLNASNDELRNRLMPLNRKWNLGKLIDAAREFPLRPRERLTFEYVLLDGINDRPENARELATLVRGMRCKVNLIALNAGPEIAFGTPSDEHVHDFQAILQGAGIPAYIRRPRGRDIYAACGQLRKASL